MRYADKKYKEKSYTVYMHICPNQKVYIGLTCQSPEGRWNNGEGYKHQALFYRAIKKYGWANIEHKIIQSNLTLDEASKLEQTLIVKYNANDSKYGYNLTNGGEGISGYHLTEEQLKRHRQVSLGRKHTQATKDKISKLNKGRKLNLTDEQRKACAERARKLPHYKRTDEQKKRMSDAYEKRRDRPGHTTPHTEETKQKISKAVRARGPVSDETRKKLSEAAKKQWIRQKQNKGEI